MDAAEPSTARNTKQNAKILGLEGQVKSNEHHDYDHDHAKRLKAFSIVVQSTHDERM